DVIAIYSSVIAHCNNLSGDAKGRIGFGQIGPQWTVAAAKEAVSNLVSDRFVLVAPGGVVGAVAGLVGNLSYFQSPTFKALAGLGPLARALKVEEQTELLKSFIVPVATERGRGTIVVRGLTTDGDQISVRRVADRAVRTMKMIGDLFIGRLNNADGRGALKQKLIEALLQMQREGAIVPSTDGKDPAFKVDVYSSQEDFAKGIVRVDMAVRPVRAIDYIYATVLVQV
ncbi:MAG: phage tail sheath protein, partial [Myxococcales bacterium]|nr:phage tail sheath protein [Myxococcales bacterium]